MTKPVPTWGTIFDGPPITTSNGASYATRRAERKNDQGSKKPLRADIQGLRAVAVLAVVVNHLSGHPVGGFVGVDVFFVISGYLISSHLITDLGRTAGIGHYVSDFYRKRVRRLFPAALVVIVLTLVAAHSILPASRYHSTVKDGLWASIFGANFRFISVGTNYFTAGLPQSPFQHYWSLSVEEQFYVVWPIALFVLAVVIGARSKASINRRRIAAGIASVLLIGISLAYAFHESTADPITAYFSTYARGWELGLGALLACVVPSIRASVPVLTGMSWAGMGAIGYGFFTVHGGSGFPAPAALLPCLGAALIIAAVSNDGERARNIVLTNRPSTYVGDISYSLYLVHFPTIILLQAEFASRNGAYFYTAATLISLGLAVVLYSAVERPILDSNFLLPRNVRRTDPDRSPIGMPALAGAMAIVIGFGAYVFWPGNQAAIDQKYAQINNIVAPTTSASPQPGSAHGPKQTALTQEIQQAIQAQVWPELTPSMASVLGGKEAPNDLLACVRTTIAPAAACTWGPASAPHVAYIAGDSVSMVYAEAFRKIAESGTQWRVRLVGAAGCVFTSVVLANADLSVQNGCAAHNAATVAVVAQARPDLLIVANTSGAHVTTTGADVSPAQWTSDFGVELAKVRTSVGALAVIQSAPNGGTVTTCYNAGRSAPIECVARVPSTWVARGQANRDAVNAVHGQFIDSEGWFCVASYCPPFVGSTPSMYDYVHPAIAYMDKIYPVIEETLKSAGVAF